MSAPRNVPPGLFAESYPELAQCFPRLVLDAVFNAAADAWEGGPEDTLTWCRRRLLELLAFLCMRSHVEYGAPMSESLTEFYCPESDVVSVMRPLCWAMSATSSEERTSRLKEVSIYEDTAERTIGAVERVAKVLGTEFPFKEVPFMRGDRVPAELSETMRSQRCMNASP